MKFIIPIRYVVMALIMLSAGVEYVARININVAIVSMVEQPQARTTKHHSVCPVPKDYALYMNESSVNSTKSLSANAHRFKWDMETRGLILGSYFYSYVVMQLPGGRLAEKYGPKYIIAAGLLMSSFINFLTPLLAESVPLLVLSRIALGFAQGPVFPACFALIIRWLPGKEKTIAFGFLDIGINMGAIVSAPLTGYLSQSNLGWPFAFYVSGTIAAVVFIMFTSFVTSSPESNRFLSEKELKVIKGAENRCDDEIKPTHNVPWVDILTSGVVWTTIITRFSLGWTFLLVQTVMPTYINDILHVPPTKNGFINALLYLMACITLATVGYISELIISKKLLSRTNTRKLFVMLSRTFMIVCVLSIPMAKCNNYLVISLLVGTMISYGMSSGADLPLPSELSKNYPATLMALINTISASAGIIAPYIVGVILNHMSDDIEQAWNLVFYLTAVICAISALTFALFGTAERQSWDMQGDSNRKSFNMSCESNDQKTEQ